ncbi:MAG TPA: DMT family transporter [Janthinobacterium sp.]|nr:DMT family transporter [Janthinobacterium sp.]
MTHQFRGILALLIVTMVWGTTFPAMKDLTVYFSPVWIIFIRFFIAGVLLLPFLWSARLRDIRSGVLLGVVLFACYAFQVEGLALTTSNRNAFICGLNVLVVPLLGVLAGKKPEPRIIVALALAVAGLFALCGDGGGGWGRGDTLALLGAFAFGCYIKLMEAATRHVEKLMTLTAAQIITVALCSALWLLARELPPGGAGVSGLSALSGYLGHIGAGLRIHAMNCLYLGVLCTAAIISLQTWGQRHSTANEAAVIYAFEPGAAAFFGYFWLGEVLSRQGWLGAALLISGMIVSQWNTERPASVLAPE